MLSEQLMMPSLRKKWRTLRDDARITLEVAFHDGIARPILVPDHVCYVKNSLGFRIEFHHFRVGYATFVVALIDGFPPIIWDLELNDGHPIYPLYEE